MHTHVYIYAMCIVFIHTYVYVCVTCLVYIHTYVFIYATYIYVCIHIYPRRSNLLELYI